jgi:ankyrin repeat protein
MTREPDVNLANVRRVTPLMAAAYAGDAVLTRLLLDRHADPMAADHLHKKTAMVYTAASGRTPVVDLLLSKGIDVNARYENSLTALMWAAGNGYADTVRLLLSRGADPMLTDNRGKTALQMALDGGHAEAAALLQPRISAR